MIFSNPAFFDISPETIIAEQEQLAELRDDQYLEYLKSGAADRIIQSASITNFGVDKSTLTEGSLLYPYRSPIWNMSVMQSDSIFTDAKLPRSHSIHEPSIDIFGNREAENHVLYLGRYEPMPYGNTTWSYAAGVLLDHESADALEKERYIPFAGVEVKDLQMIEAHLTALAAVAIEKSLVTIDPLTLSEGYGRIIGYEDSDYPEFS